MLYAVIATDVPDSLELRNQTRQAHLERIQNLEDEGRLVLAGPHPNIDAQDSAEAGMSGSLIVAEFASLKDARAWALTDPYQIAGVYAEVLVKPFKKVFPK